MLHDYLVHRHQFLFYQFSKQTADATVLCMYQHKKLYTNTCIDHINKSNIE